MTHSLRVLRRPFAIAAASGLLGMFGFAGSALGATAHHHNGGGGGGASIDRAVWDSGSVGGKPVNPGSATGQTIYLYTLTNRAGMQVKISNYGGVVQSIWVPDRTGHLVNVALGFPKLSDYVDDFTQGATNTPWPAAGGSGNTYFGAIIGRYANRIGNASFKLNGKTYTLDANNNGQTLHGGYLGWNTAVWTPSTTTGHGSASLILTAKFPAGEGCLTVSATCTGFPAPVTATVTYTLTRHNALRIGYQVVNDSSTDATVVNLTNHTYFNLGGEGNHTVYNQLLALNSDQYTPVNTSLIPQDPFFVNVAGTAYDFRTLHKIGENIRNTNLPDGSMLSANNGLKQLQIAHGYDNNWVLRGPADSYKLAAVAMDQKNGVTLKAYTTEPGVQVYTGNFLVGDLIGTSGRVYRQGDAFTLETQHYPDAPNHIGDADWPSAVLNAGATFNSTTAFQFSAGGGHGGHHRQVRFR